MKKWAFPFACAIALTACGSMQGGMSGDQDRMSSSGASGTMGASGSSVGSISAAPHVDPQTPGEGATTGDSVTDVTGEGASSPDAERRGTMGHGTSGGSATMGSGSSGTMDHSTSGTGGTMDHSTSGTMRSDSETGSISAAPHVDPSNPGAGATTGNSVTDVTGEGATAPAAGNDNTMSR